MDKPHAHPPLDTIYFNITDRCNLVCRHCWLAAGYDTGKKRDSKRLNELTLEELKGPLREAMDLGLTSIKLTGGEPFLRKDILNFIDYFKKCNLSLFFETNATLLNETTVARLPADIITDISVSLDSSEAKEHDTLRGVEGSFDEAVRGIRLLLKYNLPVQVIFSLYSDNAAKLWDAINLARSLGVGLIKINPIAHIGRAKRIDRKTMLSIEALIELEREIERRNYKGIEIFLDIPPAFKSTKYFLNSKKSPCCAITTMLGILSDGTVSLCGIGRIEKDLVMGNIRYNSLSAIWSNNSILHSIRTSIPTRLEGVCSQCLFRDVCLGSCIAQNYVKTRSLTAGYYFCEEAYNRGLFPRSRLLHKGMAHEAPIAHCV